MVGSWQNTYCGLSRKKVSTTKQHIPTLHHPAPLWSYQRPDISIMYWHGRPSQREGSQMSQMDTKWAAGSGSKSLRKYHLTRVLPPVIFVFYWGTFRLTKQSARRQDKPLKNATVWRLIALKIGIHDHVPKSAITMWNKASPGEMSFFIYFFTTNKASDASRESRSLKKTLTLKCTFKLFWSNYTGDCQKKELSCYRLALSR